MILTVLLPVYNGEKYIRETIDSILSQSYSDFEFLIINDGSTDNSKQIIEQYTDPRINYIENEKNIGLSATLNKGIDIAKGKYIVRIDADDICMPDRLQTQLDFMEQNRDISFSGTWFQILNTDRVAKLPKSNEEILATMFFYNPFGHPTIILRKEDFIKNNLYFNLDYRYSQDYELWVRASKKLKCANIENALVAYREHPLQITNTFNEFVTEEPDKIRFSLLNEFINPSEQEQILHLKLMNNDFLYDIDSVFLSISWLEKLYYKNVKHDKYNEVYFSRLLAKKWINFFKGSKKFNKKLFKLYRKSPFKKYNKLKGINYLKFFVKCLIGYSI